MKSYYIWIIIIIIIILMAVVGYIADKKDFIEKGEEKPKKEKVNKEKNEKELIVIEDKGINELVSQPEKNDSEDSLNQDIFNIPSPKEENEEIDQSLFAPLEPTSSVEKYEEVKESQNELQSVDPTPLSDIDKNFDEQVVTEEDDIWKF